MNVNHGPNKCGEPPRLLVADLILEGCIDGPLSKKRQLLEACTWPKLTKPVDGNSVHERVLFLLAWWDAEFS